MRKLDRWGLGVPSSIKVGRESAHSIRYCLGRLNEIIQVETNPRSRAILSIELERVETLQCLDVNGKPCKGIDMVRRFNNERSYGERIKKAGGIILGLEDKFDLRHYTPLGAQLCWNVSDAFGIFDHLMLRRGIPERLERSVRLFMDGSILTTPSRTEQWIVYAYKTTDKDGYPVYRCDRLPADLIRLEHDYSLILR